MRCDIMRNDKETWSEKTERLGKIVREAKEIYLERYNELQKKIEPYYKKWKRKREASDE
jgi:hypothetical protein